MINKPIWIGLIFIVMFACKSNQIILDHKTSIENQIRKNQMDILEQTEINPGQIIKIETDEAGMKYVKQIDGDKTVFKYLYRSKPEAQNIMDATYSQYVYFETGKNIKNMSLSGKELQKIKLTVVIYGFRNTTLIPVDKGDFELKITGKNTLQFHIHLDESYQNIRHKNIIQIIKTKRDE